MKKAGSNKKHKEIPDFIMKAAKKDLEEFQDKSYDSLRERMDVEKQLDAL